jgi:hypothetical protein
MNKKGTVSPERGWTIMYSLPENELILPLFLLLSIIFCDVIFFFE